MEVEIPQPSVQIFSSSSDADRPSRNISLLHPLNRLRKNAVSDLQGLKPLKKARTLCRA